MTIDNDYLVTGGIEGTQIKYYKDDFWYKLDMLGKEGEVEWLVSLLLQYSNLRRDEYVTYFRCNVNGTSACGSRDFTENGRYMFINLAELYFRSYGTELKDVFAKKSPLERKSIIFEFLREVCSLDLGVYFAKVFSLDLITLNEDRHLKNLGVIFDNVEEVYKAPRIFDNGLSLLNGSLVYNPSLGIIDNMDNVKSKPFSTSPDKQYLLFKDYFSLKFDYFGFWLKVQELRYSSRYLDVLKFRLLKYKDYFMPKRAFALYCDNERIGTRFAFGSNRYDTTYKGIEPKERIDMFWDEEDKLYKSIDEYHDDFIIYEVDKSMVKEIIEG